MNHKASPAELADRIAAAVHALDSSTLRPHDLRPSDLGDTARSLERVAYALAQVLGNLRGYLTELNASGRIHGTSTDDLAKGLQQTRALVANAAASADSLGLSLAHASSELGQLDFQG